MLQKYSSTHVLIILLRHNRVTAFKLIDTRPAYWLTYNMMKDEQMQVLGANKRVTKDLVKKKNGKGRSRWRRLYEAASGEKSPEPSAML